MSLSKSEVLHIAKLASLQIDEEEVEETRKKLVSILDYVNQLSSVDTTGVAPTSHVHGVVNAFRDDAVKPSLSLDAIKLNAPEFEKGGFKVPRIL